MKNKKQIAIFLCIIFLISYVFSFYLVDAEASKNVSSSISKKVNPIGRIIGLKLYTNGVLVIGMSEIEDENGQKVKPFENTGIKEGDLIKSANGKEIKTAKELIEIINESEGNDISIKYQRDEDDIYTNITPVRIKDRKLHARFMD